MLSAWLISKTLGSFVPTFERQLHLVQRLYPIVVVAAAWAGYNGSAYMRGVVGRHRAEAAWFLFSAVLVSFGVGVAFRSCSSVAVERIGSGTMRALAMAFAMIAFFLYAQTITIGLLSDDYTLVKQALSGVWLPDWEMIRPLPLIIWWFLGLLVDSRYFPEVLHLMNVTLHAVNAFLVFLLARHINVPVRSSAIGALLFLLSPLAVEPVVWLSGVFDLLMTALLLLAAIAIFSERKTMQFSVPIVLIAAALATKETAVAGPLLLCLMLPWVRRGYRMTAMQSVAGSALIVAAYITWRIADGVPASQTSWPSGYMMKELLSRPFGALAIPLHISLLEAFPVVGVALAVLWPTAFAISAQRWIRSAQPFKILITGVLWILVTIAPLFSLFFVGNDLQGSRYLYLGTAMWVLSVVSVAGGIVGRNRVVGSVLTCLYLAGCVTAVFFHQQNWLEAARARDRVLLSFQSISSQCAPTSVTGLPDNVAGAYVFRNGFPEAVEMIRTQLPSQPSCSLIWNGSGFVALNLKR